MGGDNGALTAEEILGFNDRPIQRVDVPEWGGRHVYIRTIGGDERDRYEQSFFDLDSGKRKGDMAGIRSRLVAICACDAEGNALFTAGQILALGKKNAAALDRLYEVARKLNGLSDADIQELAGNSSSDPSGDSGTSSQKAKVGRSPKPSGK